jgi:hypothetical protein
MPKQSTEKEFLLKWKISTSITFKISINIPVSVTAPELLHE